MRLWPSKAMILGVFSTLIAASTAGVSNAADAIQIRAGNAVSNVSTNGTGGWGVGFGYAHDLKDWRLGPIPVLTNSSIGGSIEYNELARFGDAVETEVPMSLELLWNYDMSPQIQPYWGLGGGAYYRKLKGTGDDKQFLRDGWHLALGANTPLGESQQIGLDARFSFTDSNNGTPNPVFGLGSADALHWGVKLTWTLRYQSLPPQPKP